MPVHVRHKICFIGYSKLTELARGVIDALPPSDVSYLLVDCDLESMDECVQEALEAGCEVFISSHGNAGRFQDSYDYPLVEIPVNPFDYAVAVRKAVESGHQKVAIARQRRATAVDVQALSDLLDIPITELVFETLPELFERVKESPCTAFVGAAGTVNAAEAAGKDGFLVYLGTAGIRDACLRAAELAREVRQTRINRQITNSVMNNGQLGIIVTDARGTVLFFNRMAQRFTGLLSSQVRGQRIEEFFPNLGVSPFLKNQNRKSDSYRLVGGVMMRCIQERILLKDEVVGIVTTLYPEAHNRKKAPESTGRFSEHIYHWEELTMLSESMQRLVRDGRALSAYPQPTVITGEPGSGREEIAYCIHGGSPRAQNPCITLDLATIAQQDAAHILFGYERGDRTVDGMLVNANHGSVVLKNIALAQPAVLACLQQVLNGRQIIRPGMESALQLDLRFFTVVNQGELEALSPDLSSQISIHRLDMPPLRTRREDIAPLFLKYLSILSETPMRFSLTEEMEALLKEYSWPGNVWEMRAVSTRYVLARAVKEKPSARAKYVLLLRAIGEEAVFRDLLRKYPVLERHTGADPEKFAAAVETVKHWLRWSNEKLAEQLHISRSTLWRALQGQ